jgi:surfactin synthase thioesterase subunit
MLNQDEMLIKIVSEFYDTTTVSLDSTMLAYIKKIIKGDLMLAKDYCYRKRQELIQSPITVLSGTRDPKITNQQLLGWKLFAGNKCTICKVEGNHFFPFNNGQEITSILNCTLMDS